MAKPKYKNSIYSNAYIERINNMIGRQQYSQALREFQKYFQTYPNDSIIYHNYIHFLMTIGEFKQARDIIEKIENKSLSMESNFYLNKVKFRLLTLEGKYFEALELLNKYPEIVDLGNLEDSCRYQTNSNVYYFKYQECGHVGKYYTDFFQVAALNNTTHDILTMYPCFQPEYFDYTDLDPIFKKEEEEPKLKRVSQIDKFNQRYGLK